MKLAGVSGGKIGALICDANYRRIWITGLSIAVSRWLELLAIGVFALEITGSPFLVALLVVLRMLPLVLLGSVVGTFADRISRQHMLTLGMSLGAIVSGSVAILFFFDLAGYGSLVVAAIAAGCIWSLDQPVRRRMLGDIVGSERLVTALGFDAATNNATRLIGPLLGGILYAQFGAPGAFTFTASVYALGAILTARIDAVLPDEEARPASRILTDLREGFSYVANNPDILRILLVTVVFNIGALPFISMIPVLGAEQFHLSPGWIGALAALEGLGAFLGGMTIAIINPTIGLRRIYFFGVLSYLIFAFLVAWMTVPIPASVLMFMVGLGAAGFSSMQSALTYSAAPPHMRSRVLGLLSICIGAGLIGVGNIGLMAEWFGVSAAIKIVSLECMLIMAAIACRWREMWAGI